MAIEVSNWVWKHSRSKNAARLVMLAVADACNRPDGTGAWMSNAALMARTNLSERAVQAGVSSAELLGELKVERGSGRGGVNRFTVVMTAVDKPVENAGNPADSAPFTETPQILHPADSAPIPSDEESQASTPNPADSAPKRRRRKGAESAPGTVRTKNSSSKSSTDAGDETARTILGGFIDYCAERNVMLPKRIIGHYAKEIKEALDGNIKPNLIKKALAQMLADNAINKPSTLASQIVAVQTGPQRWPARAAAAPMNDNYSSPQYAPRDEARCKTHPTELADHCTVCDSERRAVRTPQ